MPEINTGQLPLSINKPPAPIFYRTICSVRTLVNSLWVSKSTIATAYVLARSPAYLTDKLHSVMNAAAKIVCGLKQYDHITCHMSTRYTGYAFRNGWRSSYVTHVDILTYKSLHGCAPDYLTELCNPVNCTIGTKAPLVTSCSRWSDHPENNNIVWWPRLRPWKY